MQEEESMVYWYKIHTPLILDSLYRYLVKLTLSVHLNNNKSRDLVLNILSIVVLNTN
jgi:hypothetical protein